MAEYVRRRRPPSNHPYWERLHDRTHPPHIVLPILIPGAIGLAIGVYGGLRPTFTIADAFKFAGTMAICPAAMIFLIGLICIHCGRSRPPRMADRWSVGLAGVLGCSAFMYAAVLFAMLPVLVWYSACAGRGPWNGMLIGSSIGAVPSAWYAIQRRWIWRERQKLWPRWDQMSLPRPRRALNVTTVPVRADSESESPVASNNEGASKDRQPAAMISSIAIGESGERA